MVAKYTLPVVNMGGPMCGKQRKRAKGRCTAPKVENKNVAGNVDVVVGLHKKKNVSENLHLVDLELFYCF